MRKKLLLAASVATGLVMATKAGGAPPDRPAAPIDYIDMFLGMPLTLGMLPGAGGNGSRVLWTPSMTSPSTAMLYVNIATTGNAQSFGSVPAARYYANPATGFFGV